MSIEIDETMQIFIEESAEHLADIENDFLAIEEGGADVDEDLINKVYRAAHSIKGGAGFMGLTNIQNLTHEMENILGKIRNHEMVPNGEIINHLLKAADTLREMISDVTTSNDVDVSALTADLAAISQGTFEAPQDADSQPQDGASSGTLSEAGGQSGEPDDGPGDALSEFPEAREGIEAALADGKNVYLIKLDLIEDVQRRGKSLMDYIADITATGGVLARAMDLERVDPLSEEFEPANLPVQLVFATVFRPEDIDDLFEIGLQNIFQFDEKLALHPLAETSTTGVPATPAETPPAAAEGPGAPDTPEKPPVDLAGKGVADTSETPPAAAVRAENANVHATHDRAGQAEQGPRKAAASKKPAGQVSSAVEASLRVHVSLLDSLMDLAGELVLGRNQLLQAMTSRDSRLVEAASQRIDLITSELQEAIMLTRMQAIGNVFGKFPRVVRDLSRKLGKQVELVLEGKEVELDKTIIESINDPLTHLVRNAVDHGIEDPEQRLKAGKNAVGRIVLKAYHEAGQVNIVISDDGKGIDGDRLVETAVSKGLISEEQAGAMSEKEKVNLIFLPGFSTAREVTDVSGRGVGMDVVKTNLDKLGGQTEIESTPGEGTTIRIKLPLTLAIIPSQIVQAGGERYAIPQVSLVELLRIPADQVKNRIETVGDAEVVRLRGDLLPLVRLTDVIGVERTFTDPEGRVRKPDQRENLADRRSRHTPLHASAKDDDRSADEIEAHPHRRVNPLDRRQRAASALNIAVVSCGAMKYGLVVDRLFDSEEIVVKPLGRHLKNSKGYAGATIMGDGRVALILDVSHLAHMARLNSVENSERAMDIAESAEKAAQLKADRQSMLIFKCAEDEHFAVPINLVERIEKVEGAHIEQVGGKRVMQYRGGSLPLFCIDEVAQVKPLADHDSHLVIVFSLAGRELGLLATGPVDAVEMAIEVDGETLRQPGIMGSAIIGGHTTLMVDVYELVQTLNPDWFAESEAMREPEGTDTAILYAEDSAFFRSQVKRFIEEEGYRVIEAKDGVVAWELLQEHAAEVALVATDIEMPNMDGFALTEKIKGDERFAHLPVIALTTLASDADQARGKAVGIDDYQIKLDREKLITSIRAMLQNA